MTDVLTDSGLLPRDANPGAGSRPPGVLPWTARWPAFSPDAAMISVQLACSMEDAHVALRSRAFAEGQSVGDVAGEVVGRRVGFGR